MARAALGWGVRELAEKAGVTANTVNRFENGSGARVDTLEKLQKAFKEAGLEFLPADGAKGEGVRFSRPKEDRE